MNQVQKVLTFDNYFLLYFFLNFNKFRRCGSRVCVW